MSNLDYLNNSYYYIRYIDTKQQQHYIRIKNKPKVIEQKLQQLQQEGAIIL